MFPDGHHVSFADSFMSAFRLKVSNTNKAVLAVQLTILRHNIAIVAILDIVARPLEQLHIEIAAQAMRWSPERRRFCQRKLQTNETAARCQQAAHLRSPLGSQLRRNRTEEGVVVDNVKLAPTRVRRQIIVEEVCKKEVPRAPTNRPSAIGYLVVSSAWFWSSSLQASIAV